MPIRVLIADDHSVVRQGLRMFLGLDGELEVIGEAENGAEALEKARALHPDVVLMDLVMPVMDGIQATSAIRTELPDTEVVAVTSVLEDASVVGAVKALGETRKVVVVVIDPRSPASNLRREFAAEGIPIFTTKTWAERGGVFGVLEPDHADVATAHGDFMDLLSGGGLKHDGSELLTKAMRYVTARPLAGQTALDRRGDVDASPANAVTLALWAWLNRPAEMSPFFVR